VTTQLFLLLFRFHFDVPIYDEVEIHNGLCRRELLYKIDFDLCVRPGVELAQGVRIEPSAS
jgi:hypothetical protein